MKYALVILLGLSGPPLTIEFNTLVECARARADVIDGYAGKWGAELVGTCERTGE